MWPIVSMLEKDRVTDIGNMHKKFAIDRTCGDILADRRAQIFMATQ